MLTIDGLPARAARSTKHLELSAKR